MELIDFKFRGPGWYVTENDTILVVPIQRDKKSQWHQVWKAHEEFRFFVWNDPNIYDMFNLIINAPDRSADNY